MKPLQNSVPYLRTRLLRQCWSWLQDLKVRQNGQLSSFCHLLHLTQFNECACESLSKMLFSTQLELLLFRFVRAAFKLPGASESVRLAAEACLPWLATACAQNGTGLAWLQSVCHFLIQVLWQVPAEPFTGAQLLAAQANAQQ